MLARTGGDPNQLLQMGQARLSRIVAQSSHNHLGAERAEEWIDAAQAAVDLYGQHPAFAPGTRAAEVRTEVELLRAVQKELAQHATSREQAYQKVDPRGLARSLPGIADVGGPALVAIIGRPGRFPDGPSFRSYSGLAPKASETGQTDRKGEPMSKAGSTLLRTTLIRAADTARHQDPQLARIYWVQMVERGANHIKALCVVAAHLAERAHTVLERGEPYELRDTDGATVSAAEAKAIIAEHWTVSEDVRRRRRSKKAGKGPQKVLKGQSSTRRPSPPISSLNSAPEFKTSPALAASVTS